VADVFAASGKMRPPMFPTGDRIFTRQGAMTDAIVRHHDAARAISTR
jgi:hypothetical protein